MWTLYEDDLLEVLSQGRIARERAPSLPLVFTAFAQLLAPTKDTHRRVETAKAKVDREFESAVQLVRDKNFIN